MSAVPDSEELPVLTWHPRADNTILRARAELLRAIREFMHEHGILEVETPVLVNTPVSEVHIDSFSAHDDADGKYYLHTSPEYAMKRLLASGIGPVYQICRVFRANESGGLHNPEFTMLEWYRPGFDMHALMDEMDRLLQQPGFPPAEKKTYSDLFSEITGIEPHTATISALQSCASAHGLSCDTDNRSELLDFIFSHKVLPGAGRERPLLVYHFPACQPALARLSGTTPVVAERFELFIAGMEIANGFHELADAEEQRRRFHADNRERHRIGKKAVSPDEYLLAALSAGLPDCSGVAVGIDRLLMALLGIQHIQEVLAFPTHRA